MFRVLPLLLLLASLPAAAQVWPAPGDGFDWQALGDRPVKADQIAFDTRGQLWAASGTGVGNAARLADPDDPDAEWTISGSIRISERILPLGRGDTVLVAESITHRTIDGGGSWSTVSNSCSTSGGAMTEIPAGTPPGAWGDLSGVLLAGRIGLCRSDDRGATWTEVPVASPPSTGFYAHDALALPAGHAHAGRIVVASTKGMWLSDDTATTLRLRRASGPSLVYAEQPAVMPSGRILMTGIDPTQPSRLLEVSDDGGETWRRTAPLPEPVEGATGAVSLVVVGVRTALAVTGRGLVYRTDDDGETWAVVGRSPMPSGDHHATHALLDAQGRLLVPLRVRGPSIEDTWIWRTSLPQVVADETAPERAALGVSVRPNPSPAGTVTVDLAQASPGAVRAEVFDAVGRRVATLHDGAAGGVLSLPLDTSGWSPGVYTVRVTRGGAVTAETFTVVR